MKYVQYIYIPGIKYKVYVHPNQENLQERCFALVIKMTLPSASITQTT